MSYKQMDNNFSFTDLSLVDSLAEHNRSVSRMEKINAIIDWSSVESLLLKHYTVGKNIEGAAAYPPLLLLKCLLLQQWFHIESDPELETQINDRISFKKFLGLSFDQPSPDHSTFSRFRSRLSKNAMAKINSEVLLQFTSKGLAINEGIAIDARLVQSASHPLSNERLQEEKLKKQMPEGKIDKNGTLSFPAIWSRIGRLRMRSFWFEGVLLWMLSMVLSWRSSHDNAQRNH